MKYNYVIFGLDLYCYKIIYSDIIGMDDVRYIQNYKPSKNKLINFLFKIHFSVKINNIINLPYKKIWFRTFFNNDFEDNNPICYIFFGVNLILEKYGYIKYLKKKNQTSKFICFFQDLIHISTADFKNIDIEHVKKIFDLVISYDTLEAKKYDILYYPNSFSKYIVKKNDSFLKSDIYFLGAAKNRLNKILLFYQYLHEIGVKCDFYITGVKIKDQIYYNGIHYITEMTYEENLQHVENAECILEIMQDNSAGYTIRTLESIMYDKKLITDNVEIVNAPFYNPNNILFIRDINDIYNQKSFFNNFSREANHNYKNKITPINFLKFIEEHI